MTPDLWASVVIITRNQRPYLERSLPALQAQAGGAGEIEIIVVDSGSTDGALDVARGHGARIVAYGPGRFNYARAYNLGAAAARGRYLARLSGDAVPASRDYLKNLIDPMEADARVVGTWGRQILPEDVRNPLERAFEARIRPASDPAPHRYTRDITVLGSAMALRRDLWEKLPFDERLPQAEDYAWMHHWYQRGGAGVYAPRAAILHGHDESLVRALRRSLAQSALQALICLRR
jgi:rhamnosyltransferase